MTHFLAQLVRPMPGSIRHELSDRERGRALTGFFVAFVVGFPAIRWTFDALGLPDGSRNAPALALVLAALAGLGMLVLQYRQGMVSSAIPSGRIPSLLLVEDNEYAAGAMTRLLVGIGWTVYTARTRVEALQLIAVRPCAAVLDLMLPDGAGEEILQQIRWQGLPCKVVVMSAIDDPERQASLKSLGADCFVPKMGDFEALRKAVGLPGDYMPTRVGSRETNAGNRGGLRL
jgi:CheY-like chemotaxis protein